MNFVLFYGIFYSFFVYDFGNNCVIPQQQIFKKSVEFFKKIKAEYEELYNWFVKLSSQKMY